MNEYALSLFSLAKEENLLDIFYNETKFLIEIFKDEELLNFIIDKFIRNSDKKKAINNGLNSINRYLLNFINIIIDDNREDDLIEIFDSFNSLYYKEKNIVEGIIYGLEIGNEKINELEEVFSRKLKKRVVLKFKQDVSLIGGYKVIVDNKLYDNSYKNKLNKLKDKLLEEGEVND